MRLTWTWNTRLLVAAVATVALVLLLFAFLAAQINVDHPRHPAQRVAVPTEWEPRPSAPATVHPRMRSAGLTTSIPDDYARAVAAFVYGMDTRRHTTPEDYRQLLQSEADPGLSPEGRADLFATIEARLPAEEMWARMRANEQWSQWSPSRTWEPAAWSEVVTAGYAEPGWAMRNVTGTQNTHYVDGGKARATSRQPTLTVVMRCPAPGAGVDRCRLVLLSTQVVS